MTEKQLANLKPIKKGEVRNPEGGRAHSPETKMMKLLTQKSMVRIINLIAQGDVAALRKMAKDESNTALEMMFASVVIKIISKGDMDALDKLLNRMVGKVKDRVEHTGQDGGPQEHLLIPANKSDLDKALRSAMKKLDDEC